MFVMGQTLLLLLLLLLGLQHVGSPDPIVYRTQAVSSVCTCLHGPQIRCYLNLSSHAKQLHLLLLMGNEAFCDPLRCQMTV